MRVFRDADLSGERPGQHRDFQLNALAEAWNEAELSEDFGELRDAVVKALDAILQLHGFEWPKEGDSNG